MSSRPLSELLDDPSTRIADVTAWLDGRSHDERVAATRTLNRAQQRTLYTRASLAPAVTLEHFVPKGRPDRTEVRHHGRNTLPLPAPFRVFEKRFCRPTDGTERLFGYNEGASRGWIGPGYFVARSTRDNPVWAARGDIVVDYYEVPDGPVADTWPPVVPNSQGLQMFVYKGTRDYMRRVSEHVSIGAAYKGERALDHYFVLVREDV
jgi:hypothetical protein